MLIEDLFSTTQTESTQAVTKRRNKEEEGSSLPLSWGGDSVSISTEARARQQAAATETSADDNGEAAAKEAADKLSETIKQATGASSGGGDSASQLEALKKKLQQLQSKLAQVAGGSMPDETKQSMMASINAEISQVVAQLGAMEAEAAKQG